jgi:hypothetical protein
MVQDCCFKIPTIIIYFILKQFCTLDVVVVNIEAVQHDGSKSKPRAANKC